MLIVILNVILKFSIHHKMLKVFALVLNCLRTLSVSNFFSINVNKIVFVGFKLLQYLLKNIKNTQARFFISF